MVVCASAADLPPAEYAFVVNIRSVTGALQLEKLTMRISPISCIAYLPAHHRAFSFGSHPAFR